MAEKIRVIIVDDIPETRENIRKLLQFENDIEVVGVGRTGREAIDLAKEIKPDVILMDINMPDMDGITATEHIGKQTPYVKVVILSVQNDPNYMRRAMLAGARDFLSKPPTIDELTSALRRAGAMAREERLKSAQVAAAPQAAMSGTQSITATPGLDGKVIAIYSPKGGTGCTTIATNLAVTMHSAESPVCIVDGNLQFGDVAIFMNEQSKFSVADLASRVNELDAEMVNSVMVKHAATGIKILAAPLRPEYAENVTGEQFGKIVDIMRRFFAYVIVDTGRTLTDINLNLFDASDIVVLVVTQEIPAIKNSRLFLDLADALEINRKRIVLVMNRMDRRIGITPEKVGENFKMEVSGVIPFDETVLTAVNRGVPFALDKTKPINKSIKDLGDAIRKRIQDFDAPAQPAPAKTLFGKR